MPTTTDEKLAEAIHDLSEAVTGFRLETERRFGAVEKAIAENARDLKFVRWIGAFFAGALLTLAVGAGRVIWDAATLTSDMKGLSLRAEKVEARVGSVEGRLGGVEKRLDKIDAKLDAVLARLPK